MTKQTIDNYKLTSMDEPTDEVLSQLMKEAAAEARERHAEAQKRFFEKLHQEIMLVKNEWNSRHLSFAND